MDIFKLVGSIFIDNSKANESLSKTEGKAEGVGNKLVGAAKKAGEFALGLTTAAAAVGGAMVASAKKTAANADVIDKASQRMKIGAESYQELAHAAELSGVEMSTLEKAAKKLEGTDLNMDQALEQIYSLGTEEERAAKAAELFGDAVAYQMTPMLNASGEEMAAMRQEAQDLGIVMSEDAVKNGAAMNDTFTKVEETMTALSNKIGEKVMPIVQKMLDWVMEHMPEIQAIVDEAISFIMDLIDQLMPIIEALSPVIKGIFDTFKEVWNNGIKPILSGIIDFISGVFTGNWEKAFQGLGNIVKGVFDGLVGIVKLPINAVIGIVNGFIGGLNKLKIPDWVPFIGGAGVNIPEIPYLAKGGAVIGGGSAVVGEDGAELIDLPRGATVTPLNDNNNAFAGMEKRLEDMQNALMSLASSISGYRPQIVLDSGVLVGEIAPSMDNALGRLSMRELRGV